MLTCSLVASAASAAVPIRWTVETTGATPATFEAYQGETLAFEAVLKSHGKPLAAPAQYSIYWQTNGMGSAYWSADCSPTSQLPNSPTSQLSTNVMFATWSPSMDVGARVYNCFIGAPGEIYRAAFQLRLRPSPGASPGTLEPPVKVLDFATVEIANAPWPAAIEAATNDLNQTLRAAIASGDAATLAAANAYTDAHGGGGSGGGGVDTNAVRDIAGEVADAKLAGKLDGPTISASIVTNADGSAGDRLVVQNSTSYGVEARQHIGNLSIVGNLDVDSPEYLRFYDFRTGNVQTLADFAYSSDIPDVPDWAQSPTKPIYTPAEVGAASESDLAEVRATAQEAVFYGRGTFQYMTGTTNVWLEGTNYVTGAESTNRTHFVWEAGMDPGKVPCAMSMWEIRDGVKQCVWDQRDWTVFYWNFKSAQLSNRLAQATHDLAENVRTNYMKRGWAKYTAVNGLDNPATDTLWIDTPKVQLMAGRQWEKIIEVGGAGYWTITGNGVELSAADATNTFLTIKDFEGNPCFTFRKTSSYLAELDPSFFVGSTFRDEQGRVVLRINSEAKPIGMFSIALDEIFVDEDDEGCPADYEWTGSAGSWYIHFLLKPGIDARSCFAKFKIMREGENVVEHTVPIKINDGIVFEQDGVTRKIRPTISGNTVNWVVVQ